MPIHIPASAMAERVPTLIVAGLGVGIAGAVVGAGAGGGLRPDSQGAYADYFVEDFCTEAEVK